MDMPIHSMKKKFKIKQEIKIQYVFMYITQNCQI